MEKFMGRKKMQNNSSLGPWKTLLQLLLIKYSLKIKLRNKTFCQF